MATQVEGLATGATQEIERSQAATLSRLSTAKTAVLAGAAICELLGLIIAVWIAVTTTRVLTRVARSIAGGTEQTSAAAAQVSSSSQTRAAGSSERPLPPVKPRRKSKSRLLGANTACGCPAT